jgi:AraC-like DNA-binding protein
VADAALHLAARYPRIPLFALTPFRPHDGGLMLACRRAGVRVLQAGMDDPVAGELVATRTATLRRRAALRDAPALLRLTEPLQLRAWDEALLRVGTRTRTGDIAAQLGFTREHLSREFAAGGAPNLKRVIDLARILCAGDLLGNPAYTVPTVGRILRFASPSHFAASARRIAGASPRELPRLGLPQILSRFLRGRMRSRL